MTGRKDLRVIFIHIYACSFIHRCQNKIGMGVYLYTFIFAFGRKMDTLQKVWSADGYCISSCQTLMVRHYEKNFNVYFDFYTVLGCLLPPFITLKLIKFNMVSFSYHFQSY